MGSARFLLATGLMAFGLAACHKNSSSSSATGSYAGAAGNLTNLVLGYSSITPASLPAGQARTGRFIKPRAFNTCATINFTITEGPNASCPNGSSDFAFKYSGAETMNLSSCTAGGYTFDGGFDLNITSAEIICVNTSNAVDFLSGQIDLTSSSMTITGNGIDYPNCSINIPLTLSESNGAPMGNSSGATVCGEPVSVTAN